MAHCDFFPQIMGIEQKNYKKNKIKFLWGVFNNEVMNTMVDLYVGCKL